MFDKPTRKFLEDLHFDKATLDQNLKFKYENCNYNIRIPFDCLPKFKSVAMETLYNGGRKTFRFVSNRKDHDHKDRENVGRFIHLLAAKYKYDLLRGMDVDDAGFLHIDEIDRLREDGCTKIPSTIYRSLQRLLRNAQKSNSVENRFLSKFLFAKDQLFHLICWCGNVGSGPDDPSRNTLFWLNLPAENIKITDGAKECSDSQLRERLSLLFPKKCLLTKAKTRKAVDGLIERYQNKASFADIRKNSKPHIDEISDSRLIKFREMLKQEAISHLEDKLHYKGLEDYIPRDLEMGLIKKTGPNETSVNMNQAHNRIWEDFDCNKLQNPQGFYILSSEVGSGKTVFLRDLQLTIIEKTDLIPIFLEASELETLKFKKRNPNSFLKSLSGLLDQEDNPYEFLKNYQDKLVFLFDGLDQIEGTGTEYGNLVEKLFSVIRDKTVITSRPFAAIDIEIDSKFKFLRLRNFNDADINAYFAEKYKRAKQLCRTCPEMIRIPMLAYMVRSLIEEGRDCDVKNRTGLYKEFIDGIFEKYRHKNLKMSEEKRVKIRKAYGEISFKAIANDTPYLQKIPCLFAINCKEAAITVDDLFKYGIANIVVNRSPATEKSIYFSHQSFQEYLAAEYISRNEGKIQQVLSEKWNPKWKEVIRFLTGIKGQGVIETILSEKDNSIHSKLFFSAELAIETDSSLDLKTEISKKIKELLDNPLFNDNADVYWAYINEKKALNRLIKRLKDDDKWSRRPAIDALVELKEKIGSDIAKKIAGKLEDENSEIRISAVSALGELKERVGSDIVKKIADRLEDENEMACCAVIKALGRLKDKVGDKIVKKIAGKLEDKNSEIRISAVSALGELKERVGSDIIKKIVDGLEDKNEMVRCAVVNALGRFKDKVDRNIIKKIADRLEDGNKEVRSAVVNVLRELKDKIGSKIIKEIVDRLENKDSEIRSSAVFALGELNGRLDSDVVKKIVGKFEDKDDDVRCLAVYAFEKLKDIVDSEIIGNIVDKLEDENYKIRESAVGALGRLKGSVSSDVVAKIIDRLDDKNEEVHISALYALGQLKDKVDSDVVEKIADRLGDEDKDIRTAALSALGKLKDKVSGEVFAKIVDRLEDEDEWVRISALYTIEIWVDKIGSEVVEKIADRLEDEDRTVRRTAIEVFGQLKNKVGNEIIAKIADRLEDEYEDVQSSASYALRKLKDKVDSGVVEKIVVIKNRSAVKLLRVLYQDGKLEFLSKT